jgi:hypothetical protein
MMTGFIGLLHTEEERRVLTHLTEWCRLRARQLPRVDPCALLVDAHTDAASIADRNQLSMLTDLLFDDHNALLHVEKCSRRFMYDFARCAHCAATTM